MSAAARHLALVAALAAAVAPAPARADGVDAIVRAQLEPLLDAGLGIDAVHVPRSLAAADLDPAAVVVAPPRALRAGRASVRVTTPAGALVYVPVTIVAIAEVALARRALRPGDTIGPADVDVVTRPAQGAAAVGLVIGAKVTRPVARDAIVSERDIALPAPLSRGAPVAIEIVRGGVRVRGTGVLELAARPGQPAVARLAQTRQVLHGTLVAPATVIVGGTP